MADIIDEANELVELQLSLALAKRGQAVVRDSAFYCVQCDDVIPHARRAALAGVQLCMACQRADELKQKQGVR